MQAIVDGIVGVPIQPARKTWNKIKNGEKVAGDHKKTDGTTKKPETIAEIGGKINMSIKNFNAKNSRYGPGGYKTELFRYLNELKEMGGQPTAGQHEKLRALADTNEDLRNLMHIFAEGPQGDPPPIAQDDPPPVDHDEPMVRPDGTPRRPSPDPEDQNPAPPKRPHIEPRVLAAAAPVLQSSATTEMPIASNAGPSGGSDPSGNGATWSCQSFSPRYEEGPDGLTVTFGGSRLQYTWALDMRTHNVADFGDFVPMGHTVPWHWIPFYCTPAEWAALPWQTHDMHISRIGVSITPVGKEVQFATASGDSTIASNEHLAIGFKSVGLNRRIDLPAVGIRRVKNNENASKLIVNSSDNPSYLDLRTRYWGPLSDFTVNTEPNSYTTNQQVSTAELSIRENEIVCGIYVDKFDKTTKANNKAVFGSVLKDRYVERFPLLPQMGKPIIQEVYSPKMGMINNQPHRILLQNSKACLFGGSSNTATQVWYPDDLTKDNKVTLNLSNANFSRNANIGTKELTKIGSYHASVEKYRILKVGGDRSAAQHDGSTVPMITFGVCPIRLINLTSSSPEYVNARCVWKIDYFMEIKCKFQVPSHPFATNISADGTIYPPNMYISPIPRELLLPVSFDTTVTDQPLTEELTPYAMHIQKGGHVEMTSYLDNAETLVAVMGAGSSASWNAKSGGLLGI
jgi:hypothetical protein